MGVVVIKQLASEADLKIAQEDYGEYVKAVVDVATGEMALGGEWHADGEKVLLEQGAKQADIWGGGVDLATRQIDFDALINVRPGVNPSHVILDAEVRQKFENMVKLKLGYAK